MKRNFSPTPRALPAVLLACAMLVAPASASALDVGPVTPLEPLSVALVSGQPQSMDVTAVGTDFVVVYATYTPVSELFAYRIDAATGVARAGDLPPPDLLMPDSTSSTARRAIFGNISSAYDGSSTVAVAWFDATAAEFRVAFLDATTLQPKTAADRAGRPLATGSSFASTPNPLLRWDGTSYILVWYDASTIKSVRVDATTGEALAADGPGVTLAASEGSPNVACSTQGCLISWTKDNAAYFGHFSSATGQLLDESVFDSAVSDTPAVAWDGTRYVVALQKSTLEVQFVAAAAGSPNGPVVTTSSTALASEAGISGLAFDGTEYAAVSCFTGAIVAFPPTLDAGGTVTEWPNVLAGQDGFEGGSGMAAGNGRTFPFCAESLQNEGFSFDASHGTVATADGPPGSGGLELDLAPSSIPSPFLVATAGKAWELWQDDRAASTLVADNTSATTAFGSYEPRVATLDIASGAEASVSSVATLARPTATYVPAPFAATTDGTSAIAAIGYSSYLATTVSLARFAANGAVAQLVDVPAALSETGGTFKLALTPGDGELLLSAFDAGALYTLVVDTASFAPKSDLTQLAARPSLAPSDNPRSSVTFDGTNFFLVWTETSSAEPQIKGARVGSNGQMVDAAATVYGGGLGASLPAVDFDGGTYLIVWSATPVGGKYATIQGQRVGTDGHPIGPVLTIASSATEDLVTPSVGSARDGLNFVVTWSTATEAAFALVGVDGTLRQPEGVALAGITGAAQIASVGPGEVLLAFAPIVATSQPYGTGSEQISLVHLSTGQTSGACTTSAQCATLACVDGFCCNTPCSDACQTCAATPGTCTPVTSKSDPDTCTGVDSCNAKGVCVAADAAACAKASDCASGFCVDGICCDSACDGSCATCTATATRGHCTALAAGSSGTPSCKPYVCDGASQSCPSACASDAACAQPYTCDEGGACELLVGAACIDTSTQESSTGVATKCTPYICRGNGCLTACQSIADCASGFVCDANEDCVLPTSVETSGGCGVEGDGGGNEMSAVFGVLAVGLRRRRRCGARGRRHQRA